MYIMTSCVLWTIVLLLLLFCIPLLLLILILIQLHLLVLFSSISNQTISTHPIWLSYFHFGIRDTQETGARGVSDVQNGRIYVHGDEFEWVGWDWGLNVVYVRMQSMREHSYPLLYIQHLIFMFIYSINSPSPVKIQLLCWYSQRDTYFALILPAIYPLPMWLPAGTAHTYRRRSNHSFTHDVGLYA